MSRPRLVLADDHRLVAEGIKALLAAELDLVALVEDGEALVEAARILRPDVIVADIAMPRLNGFEALARLREHDPQVRLVFLTMHPEVGYARRALEAGALGYVLKHAAPAELMTAIRAALEGKTYVSAALAQELCRPEQRKSTTDSVANESVTPRQREILQHLAKGHSAKEIARQLAISHRTVEYHKDQMMKNLGFNTTAQLVGWAVAQGLVALERENLIRQVDDRRVDS
jgi:DNA-binding NarL/FixJ family response regulator